MCLLSTRCQLFGNCDGGHRGRGRPDRDPRNRSRPPSRWSRGSVRLIHGKPRGLTPRRFTSTKGRYIVTDWKNRTSTTTPLGDLECRGNRDKENITTLRECRTYIDLLAIFWSLIAIYKIKTSIAKPKSANIQCYSYR